MTFIFFLSRFLSTSSSSSSLYMPLAISFIFYLIHARFPLHLWFTRSLKKDWSPCSVARQFLLLVASNLHFFIRFTPLRWEDIFLNSFSLHVLLSSIKWDTRSVLAQISLNELWNIWRQVISKKNKTPSSTKICFIHLSFSFDVSCAKKKCKQNIRTQTIGHHWIKGVEKKILNNLFSFL